MSLKDTGGPCLHSKLVQETSELEEKKAKVKHTADLKALQEPNWNRWSGRVASSMTSDGLKSPVIGKGNIDFKVGYPRSGTADYLQNMITESKVFQWSY